MINGLTLKCKLKCWLNPWMTHWVLALLKGIREPHEEKKNSFDLGGKRTHDLRIRCTVTLPTELRGRTEKVRDDFGGESLNKMVDSISRCKVASWCQLSRACTGHHSARFKTVTSRGQYAGWYERTSKQALHSKRLSVERCSTEFPTTVLLCR